MQPQKYKNSIQIFKVNVLIKYNYYKQSLKQFSGI